MTKPFVSIIIPTFNRSQMLRLTLDSFLAQDYGAENFEIIVANNNSKDDTSKVIDEYLSRYSNVSSLFVSRQGVHYARNEAALKARGQILYFTDDDMVADRQLLSKMVPVFDRFPELGTVTGKVVPRFEMPPPKWVLRDLINCYLSVTDRSREERLIISQADVGVFSCHQAIRRDVFFKAGGFNPENTNGVWIGDGETGLNIKIRKLGYDFGYVSESVIEHIIPAKRTNLRYLIYRIGNEGFCAAYTQFRAEPTLAALRRSLFFLNLLNFAKEMVRSVLAACRGKRSLNFALAFLHYYKNKSRYEWKLLRSAEFREVVLIDDWIANIDREIKLFT